MYFKRQQNEKSTQNLRYIEIDCCIEDCVKVMGSVTKSASRCVSDTHAYEGVLVLPKHHGGAFIFKIGFAKMRGISEAPKGVENTKKMKRGHV